MRKSVGARTLLAICLTGSAAPAAFTEEVPATTATVATKPADDPAALEQVLVEARRRFNRETRYSHLLPEVDDTRITVTRKNSVENLDEQPTIIDNNQRELFARMPGLMISEQQNPGQVNINYRGIGGSGALGAQESELLMSLQDGIPIASDWIGFPTQYYLPVPQGIQSVQLIRGGAALMYGPGAGAAVNYISRQPDPNRELGGYTEQVFGSNSLYSTFNTLSGTRGNWNYLVNADYRRSDSERDNGDYAVKGADLHVGYKLDAGQSVAFDLHAYSSDNGEAGRMSYAQFEADPHFTVTPKDHDWVQRYTGVLSYRGEFGKNLLVESKLWGGYHDQSERNAAGAAPGAIPASMNLVDQEFRYLGLDTRARLRWGRGNAASFGFTYFHDNSPRRQFTTTNIDADGDDRSGTPTLYQKRGVDYGALFAENVFRFGSFHVLPSVRFEREVIEVHEPLPAGTRAPINKSFANNTPLFGLGFGNDFGTGNETYVNVSQGYRPVRFLDVAPTSSKPISANNDPQTPRSLTFEAGVHGWPILGFYYDLSVFQTNYKDRIESVSTGVGTETINVNSGNTRHRGAEGQVEYDFLRLFPRFAAAEHFSGFLNADYLDAEFTSTRTASIAVGNKPGYAPPYIVRGGLLWRRDGRYKFSLSAVSVGSQYVQDSNQPLAGSNAPAKIPHYTVADFGVDYCITPHIRLLGGISNLFDRKYYSRVLFGGLEPANGRSFNLGASVGF